jgi:hypothetical protein
MKHFIQFDENGEIQFVVKAEFDAVIADENKSCFVEVSEAQAEEVKKNPKDHKVSAGKVSKKPPKPAEPSKNALRPIVE